MNDLTRKRHKGSQIRCPICQGRTQSPFSSEYIKGIRDKRTMGIRHCRKCNLIIPLNPLVGFWTGEQVVKPKTQVMVIVSQKGKRKIGVSEDL